MEVNYEIEPLSIDYSTMFNEEEKFVTPSFTATPVADTFRDISPRMNILNLNKRAISAASIGEESNSGHGPSKRIKRSISNEVGMIDLFDSNSGFDFDEPILVDTFRPTLEENSINIHNVAPPKKEVVINDRVLDEKPVKAAAVLKVVPPKKVSVHREKKLKEMEQKRKAIKDEIIEKIDKGNISNVTNNVILKGIRKDVLTSNKEYYKRNLEVYLQNQQIKKKYGKHSTATGRRKISPNIGLRFPRPRGRAPKDKVWDADNGKWVKL